MMLSEDIKSVSAIWSKTSEIRYKIDKYMISAFLN